jgi:ribosomal protein L15
MEGEREGAGTEGGRGEAGGGRRGEGDRVPLCFHGSEKSLPFWRALMGSGTERNMRT